MEQTFVMLKPDALQRCLIGTIIERIEKKGLKLVALKMLQVTPGMAQAHYAEHVDKPFFKGLVEFITSAPVVAMVIEGKQAVSVIRKLMGSTNPLEADEGTIRGDFGMDLGYNLIHGSDSQESAKREIALFFSGEEIYSYDKKIEEWVYEA